MAMMVKPKVEAEVKMKAADRLKAWKAKANLSAKAKFNVWIDRTFQMKFSARGAHVFILPTKVFSPMTEKGVKKLCALLSDPDLEGIELDIFRKYVFQPHHYDQLVTAICENTSIISMTLWNPSVLYWDAYPTQSACSIAVAEILEHGSLEQFTLLASARESKFRPSFWDGIGSAIGRNRRLLDVRFHAAVDFNACRAITSIIRINTSLESLSLDRCSFALDSDTSSMLQAIAMNQTLFHLSMEKLHFGLVGDGDPGFAHQFFLGLQRAAFDNVALSTLTMLPQREDSKLAKQTSERARQYAAENDEACITRGLVFMFCIREVPEDRPLAILRGFPFQSEDFPMIRYINEARGWVPRKALGYNKRKEAPGDVEGQSAAKRPK